MAESGIKKLRIAGALAAVGVLVVVVLWFVGVFEPGVIPPGEEARPPGLPEPEVRDRVERVERPDHYVAVGTIRSVTKATVSAQANGRVTSVRVDAGDPVEPGDVMAILDSQEMETRVAQARSKLDSARAELADAELHYGRMKRLLPEKAVTQVQMDQARARLRQARAAVNAAEKRMEEAQIILGYTRIAAPMSGVVERRKVDPGDLAWPGKPLFVIHNPKGLRLEANVREGMISRVRQGQPVRVEIGSLGRTVEGAVDEIVPSADPVSRSFLVKVSLPATEGLYPGMFGKLKVRLADRPTVLVPEEAVSEVGQLTTVRVLRDGRWVRRYVTLGERTDGEMEILSGLEGGEIIGWDRPATEEVAGAAEARKEAP